MQASHVAAVLSAACLLSACGFVPPAPPIPDHSPRVVINRGDPRLIEIPVQPIQTAEPVTIAQVSATSPEIPGNLSATSTPGQDAPANTAAPIPVPEAPPKDAQAKGKTATENASPQLATSFQSAPIVAAASLVIAQAAQPTLPEDVSPAGSSGAAEPTVAPEPIILKEIWAISPTDGTVRQALARWAAKAGWTFGPDQWELNFDLPIQAPAEFEADSFQEATQALSQAVAMSESPIRPCFYGNRVLRMVPFTRSCNRSPATQS